jgi:serine/threonine-protein kinase
VERIVGRGAMGVIYQAIDPVINRKVAIKLIRADILDGADREDFVARFRREAQAAGRCVHPNIVAIYDFSMHDGNPFLVMEFVEGASLGQVLKQRGKLPPEEAVAVALQVLAALGSAHAVGVVHRDVKPANILLLPDSRVKMTDFGIARFENSDLTQHGTMIGTLAYMSPEQCMGKEVDARSDLFSAASVLYEMLSGSRAFTGGSSAELTYRLINESPPDIDGLADGLPAVLRRALAKPPAQRFCSAQETAEVLRATRIVTDMDLTVGARAARTGRRITTAETERAERALAEYLGPIAKVLVKRALRTAETPAVLWDTLAGHIEQQSHRAAFLLQRGS